MWVGLGAEFMPKLDEGALWVRATMPYTISFDESARIVPQIRAILHSFPEVTVVADEHGRPDDGTDPTGFFNAEFYVGLQALLRVARGRTARRPSSSTRSTASWLRFPGITFNYTQPAEDAVDEAETGLKSSLDVKVFGGDLGVLQEQGKAIKHVMEHVRGHHAADAGPGAGPAVAHRQRRSRQDRAVRHQRGRRQRADRSRRRRIGSHAGRAGREVVRPHRASAAAVPRDTGGHRQHSRGHASRPADPAPRAGDDRRLQRRGVHLSAGQRPLHRHPVFGPGSRSWPARCRRRQREVARPGALARRLPCGLGRRISGLHGLSHAIAGSCCH